MILRIGDYMDEVSGEIKPRCLVFGRAIKDGNFKTVGAKGISMLTFGMSPGRGENLVNIKMWGFDAVDYADIKKGTTILADTYEDKREYGGKTYTDYVVLNVIAIADKPMKARNSKRNVEPEDPTAVFQDITNVEELPF